MSEMTNKRYEDDVREQRFINGERIVRLRQVKVDIGAGVLGLAIMWTLTNPNRRKHLLAPKIMESQARLAAKERGWRVIS